VAFRRVIGMVTVRDGRAVKSSGYARWQPAGGIRSALLNLDRWGADEIVLTDVSRRDRIDPAVLVEIGRTPLSTPLTYGGGLRSLTDVQRVMAVGVDRVVVESMAWDDPDELQRIAEVIGAQAVIVSLPVARSSEGPSRAWTPPAAPTRRPDLLIDWEERLRGLAFEELLVSDVTAEGSSGAFALDADEEVVGMLARLGRPVIWFGGVDHAAATRLIGQQLTTGIAIGNPLHEHELVIPHLRTALRAVDPDGVRAVRPSRG